MRLGWLLLSASLLVVRCLGSGSRESLLHTAVRNCATEVVRLRSTAHTGDNVNWVRVSVLYVAGDLEYIADARIPQMSADEVREYIGHMPGVLTQEATTRLALQTANVDWAAAVRLALDAGRPDAAAAIALGLNSIGVSRLPGVLAADGIDKEVLLKHALATPRAWLHESAVVVLVPHAAARPWDEFAAWLRGDAPWRCTVRVVAAVYDALLVPCLDAESGNLARLDALVTSISGKSRLVAAHVYMRHLTHLACLPRARVVTDRRATDVRADECHAVVEAAVRDRCYVLGALVRARHCPEARFHWPALDLAGDYAAAREFGAGEHARCALGADVRVFVSAVAEAAAHVAGIEGKRYVAEAKSLLSSGLRAATTVRQRV